MEADALSGRRRQGARSSRRSPSAASNRTPSSHCATRWPPHATTSIRGVTELPLPTASGTTTSSSSVTSSGIRTSCCRRLGRGRLGSVFISRVTAATTCASRLLRAGGHLRPRRASSVFLRRRAGWSERFANPSLPGHHCRLATSMDASTLAHSTRGGTDPRGARRQGRSRTHRRGARSLLHGILEALGALHGARLVHGSLRLENVLVGTDARRLRHSSCCSTAGGLSPHRRRPDQPMAGAIASRPSVRTSTMSPVADRGASARPRRSDLYSFGAVLYELLTGRPVFEGQSAAEAFMAHLTREPKPPSRVVAVPGWGRASDVDELVNDAPREEPVVSRARRPRSPSPARSTRSARRALLKSSSQDEVARGAGEHAARVPDQRGSRRTPLRRPS